MYASVFEVLAAMAVGVVVLVVAVVVAEVVRSNNSSSSSSSSSPQGKTVICSDSQSLLNAISHASDDGVRSTGRQTNWATVNWVTNQPGDNQLGDNIWSTGRQIIKFENSIMQP